MTRDQSGVLGRSWGAFLLNIVVANKCMSRHWAHTWHADRCSTPHVVVPRLGKGVLASGTLVG